MSIDNEMFEKYEEAIKRFNEKMPDLLSFSNNYDEWVNFVNLLREGYSSAAKLEIPNGIPEVLYDYRGVEWQINSEPSDDRVMFDESGDQTIANMVFRELEIARARQEWNQDDSFQEFSDLDDDEDEMDRTAFENAWLSMEKERQREFYEEFIKGQVPPKKKETGPVKGPEVSEPQGSDGQKGLPDVLGNND